MVCPAGPEREDRRDISVSRAFPSFMTHPPSTSWLCEINYDFRIRLKFNFVNITDKENPQQVSRGACPVLASIFSDEFTVFSAKKFPGVIESTAISKCFATQGIKIPIRKDGPRGNVRENSNENEDD